MKKKFLFITMASEKYGIGHLERSLKLGRNLKKKNEIYLCGLNKKYKKNLDKLLFKKIFLLNSYNPTNKSVFKFISSIKPDLCIVDLPKADSNFEKKLYESNFKFLVYDNLSRKKIYSNYLINLNPLVLKKDYKKIIFYNNCKLLLGINYFQFNIELSKLNKKIKKIKKILLFFGGGQIRYNLLYNVLKNISETEFNKKDITFVSKQKIDSHKKNYFKDKFKMNLNFLNNLSSLDNVLKKTDLAIITSGTISFEVSFLKIPMVLISIAKNQEIISKSWSKLGAGLNVGDYRSRYFSKTMNDALLQIAKKKSKLDIYHSQKNIYKNYNNKLVELLNKI